MGSDMGRSRSSLLQGSTADGAEPSRGATRRQVLKGAAVLVGGAAVLGGGIWASSRGEPDPTGGGLGPAAQPPAAGSGSWLDLLAENTVSGGPGKDGIPAIDKPRFFPASQMRELEASDPVFGLTYRGGARAYPQMVLVWHEIVNDRIGGRRISVTYCPLTGSAFGVRGAAGGKALTFGTTGMLVNSNLLMYDRQTDSEWPQLAATAIRGRLRGQRLSVTPLVWTTWSRWRKAHPETLVLSTDTGHIRQYGSDPYGSYTPPGGYYTDDDVLFPVLSESDRLDRKQVVVGVRAGGGEAAVVKDHVQARRRVEFTLGDAELAAVWDERLAAARIVRADGGDVAFFDVMWFAWHAFFPKAEVIG